MILGLLVAGLAVVLFALPALIAGKLSQRLFDHLHRHKRP